MGINLWYPSLVWAFSVVLKLNLREGLFPALVNISTRSWAGVLVYGVVTLSFHVKTNLDCDRRRGVGGGRGGDQWRILHRFIYAQLIFCQKCLHSISKCWQRTSE